MGAYMARSLPPRDGEGKGKPEQLLHPACLTAESRLVQSPRPEFEGRYSSFRGCNDFAGSVYPYSLPTGESTPGGTRRRGAGSKGEPTTERRRRAPHTPPLRLTYFWPALFPIPAPGRRSPPQRSNSNTGIEPPSPWEAHLPFSLGTGIFRRAREDQRGGTPAGDPSKGIRRDRAGRSGCRVPSRTFFPSRSPEPERRRSAAAGAGRTQYLG